MIKRYGPLAATLSLAAQVAQAQVFPVVAPDAMAAQLMAAGVDSAQGFRMLGSVRCRTGGPRDDWAYRCTAAMADEGRGGRTAALEFMLFRASYDLQAMDTRIRAALAREGARWQLAYQPRITLKGGAQALSVSGTCHQGRGERNSPGFCLTPVGPNALLFTQVEPAESGSPRITQRQDGGPDSFDDMAHAGVLASLGAVTIAKALDRGTPLTQRADRASGGAGTR